MAPSSYIAIIDACFGCVLLLVFLPIVVFLARTRRHRLNDMLAYFDEVSVRFYYDQFFPSQPQNQRTKADFDNGMKARYSWGFYAPPLAVLLMLTLVLSWGSASTLQRWFSLSDPKGTAFPGLGISALAGAILWIVADELDRLRRRDFTTTDVYNYSFRLLISIPFSWALARILTESAGLPVAFFIGAFPTSTLFQIARRIGAKQLNLADDPDTGALELEKLPSINKKNAERFQDEGINTVSQLAYCDPIDLTFRTNFDFNYVVDCVSQALLAIYFPTQGAILCSYSLRGSQETGTFVAQLRGQTGDQQQGLEVLNSLAAALNLPAAALKLTFEQVADDPYNKFLQQVWH
jgi:hypothetical protein